MLSPLVLLFAAAPALLSAQAGVRPTPAPREHHAITYDPASRSVIVSGGVSRSRGTSDRLLDDVWSWDGHRWNSIAATTGLTMVGHQLFADGAGGVFAFDGRRTTVRWTDGKWSVVTDDSTMRRAGAAGAFDTHRRRFVMYGGSARPRVVTSDTWEFNGREWTQVATSGPPPLMGAPMVYDERRRVMVLFGGYSSTTGRYLGETWEWNGMQWTRVATTGPDARSGAGMVYDSKRGETILFGGADSTRRMMDDTWAWNGTTWRRVNVPGPSGRTEGFMAFDAARGIAVLFGGSNATDPTLAETWEWDGAAWRQRS